MASGVASDGACARMAFAQGAGELGDVSEMAHAFVVMSVVGAALCGLSLLADLTPDENRPLEIALVVLTVAFAGALFAVRRRTSPRFYSIVALPAATAVLSLGLYLSGDPANPAAILYVLVALYAFYFFSRPVAFAQLAVAAVTYALALAPITIGPMALDRWIFALGAAALAGVIVAALRDRLVAQARVDWLTGLPNRRAFQERLEREVSRVRRDHGALALVLADLDEFKIVNDRLGHDAGDRALRHAARSLASTVRDHDLVARLGGDEFGVLLIGGDDRAAREFAARALGVLAEDASKLTISLGAAVATDDCHTATGLFRAADGALYAAKRAGGGQLALA